MLPMYFVKTLDVMIPPVWIPSHRIRNSKSLDLHVWPYVLTTGICLERNPPYTSGTTSQTGTCNSNSFSKKKPTIGATFRMKGAAVLDAALNT
ncbi:hypothetical protein H310_06889 [Aphanomyces invadans]|uniref:Uncharacterized protein n=1 Tax=Aphanomyces invadans TaxID=157072 RepID=A0A024U6U2_9STRA|nr:hypothetical protein H310_06889 [Aphanomyces invadans]ETW01328.1 hypothetical protein H310_06889 [Aphanomyces invadans]|eukprot:XP_008870326.1 hypothetical protein H310_06889 [Aphanomyces invadans]